MDVSAGRMMTALWTVILIGVEAVILLELLMDALILSLLLNLREYLVSGIRSTNNVNQDKLEPIYDHISDLRSSSLADLVSSTARQAQILANTLTLTSQSIRADTAEMEVDHATILDCVSAASLKQRKAPPPPIDVEVANANRAVESLPAIRRSEEMFSAPSMPSSSRSGSRFEVRSLSCDPVPTRIYAQMRSPASSTPFPSDSDYEYDSDKSAIYSPTTATFQSDPFKTPLLVSTESPITPTTAQPADLSPYKLEFTPTDFYTRMQTAEFPYTRSKRLERMLMRLVDPIQTDATTFTVNPNWWKTRTSIQGRWELLRRPSQLRLGMLMERERYLAKRMERRLYGFSEEDQSTRSDDGAESTFGDADDERTSADEIDDGFPGLPTPISLFSL